MIEESTIVNRALNTVLAKNFSWALRIDHVSRVGWPASVACRRLPFCQSWKDSHSFLQPWTSIFVRLCRCITSIHFIPDQEYIKNCHRPYGLWLRGVVRIQLPFEYARRTSSNQLRILGNLLVKDRAECDRLN